MKTGPIFFFKTYTIMKGVDDMHDTFKRYRIQQLEKRKKEIMNLIGINMESYEFTGDEYYKETADKYVYEFNEIEQKIEEIKES